MQSKTKKMLPEKEVLELVISNLKGEDKEVESPPVNKAQIPYPTRPKKDQEDDLFKNFLEPFKQLHINLPFVKAFT